MTFIDFEICDLTATLPVLHSVTLTNFLRSNMSNVSKTVRANAKLQGMTFVFCNICYRMTSLQMLYSLTLIYFFKVKYFKCKYLENGVSYKKVPKLYL